MSTQVSFRQSDDQEPFMSLQLDTIPRVGERINIPVDDGMRSWAVIYVLHDFITEFRAESHTITLVLSFLPEAQHHLDVQWENETDRPEWLPKNLIIECSHIPRPGEVIALALIEAERFQEILASQSDIPAPSDRIVHVEVVAIAHACFCEQTDEDRENDLGIADMQSEIIVRKAVNNRGDIQQILARTRRN